MAYYPSCQDYLYDQFVLPLKKAIKNGDEKEINELIDFFCGKYIEVNAFAKGHVDYIQEKYPQEKFDTPIMEYVNKYVAKYNEMKPWEECITIYSSEEE